MSEQIIRSEVCDYVDERLSWLVNESLDSTESGRLLRHLEGCEGCRSRLGEERIVHSLSTQHLPADEIAAFGMNLPTILPAEDIGDHLRVCKDCSAELEGVRNSRPRPLAHPYRWAAAALLVLGVSYVGSQSLLSDAPPGESKLAAATLEGEALDAQSPALFEDSFESGTIGFWSEVEGTATP